MDEQEDATSSRATIKVCLGKKCHAAGGESVLHAIKGGFAQEEAAVLPIHECFGCCQSAPNIAINDNIMKDVRPITVAEEVRKALDDPSCKADGLGSRSIDDLDAVLDDIERL